MGRHKTVGIVPLKRRDHVANALLKLTVVIFSGEPTTDDFPGEAPWAFTGGTIKRVAVDVSGAPYVDLEREAQAMLARE